jgi:internalin A
LNLRSTPVNDAGLAYLKSLSDLSYLDLQSTQVTNAGLVHLKGLTNLQFLSLRDTEVSDSGLVHVRGLTDLKVLIVGTQVTNAGVNDLKHALPSLTVSR